MITEPSRRRALQTMALGAVNAVLWPSMARAGEADAEHRPHFEVPFLAEDPTNVPVRVSVAHPMDRDHFIRSIDLVLEADPVPHKGTFHFTPSNGQAAVAFHMRSGVGGVLRATVECSRHGRFTGERELRVAGDGCASTQGIPARDRLGRPRLRRLQPTAIGQTVEVLAHIEHDSDTGLSLRGGRYVRVRPEFFVKQLRIYLDRDLVSDFRFTAALSSNPLVRFPLRVTRAGRLRAVFINSEGRQWEAVETLRISG